MVLRIPPQTILLVCLFVAGIAPLMRIYSEAKLRPPIIPEVDCVPFSESSGPCHNWDVLNDVAERIARGEDWYVLVCIQVETY